ncbi:MAG: hypothetical protein JO340_00150 [Acidobacteriaceae bacterium]|nr:hypothetical protein [Acidobacteriaceae bacterium]
MIHPHEIELTAAELVILTDLIYESVPETCFWGAATDNLLETRANYAVAAEGLAGLIAFTTQTPRYASPCSTA